MQIYGEITGIKYKEKFDRALSESGSFVLEIDKENRVAVSRWVSPKSTRSYPSAEN
jgi:hypothetical protein